MFQILYTYCSNIFQAFAQALANIQSPFNKHMALINRNFVSTCRWRSQALIDVNANFEMTVLVEIKGQSLQESFYLRISWFIFPYLLSTIVSWRLFEFRWSIAQHVSCLLCKRYSALSSWRQRQFLPDSFSCQFLFMFHTKKGCSAFFWMKDLLLNLDCGESEGKCE